MTDVLALKYRPQKFSDVIGQNINSVVLERMVDTDQVPQGLLFTGPRGTGKTSTARILASSLDAGDPIEIDAASHGLVADVREMIETLRYSTGSKYRVLILDEAHSMSKEAFNALLKTLEEPPGGTIFILVTTEPEKIPGTVLSRLMEFTFRKISAADVKARLTFVQEQENISVDSDLLDYIAERSDGAVRDALMMLDQCWKAGIASKEEFMAMSGDADVAPDLVLSMLTKNHSYIFSTLDEVSQRMPDSNRIAAAVVNVLRDVLVLKSGGTLKITGEGLDKRKIIADYLEPERVVASMRMLWELRTKVRASSSPRSNLELAIVLVSDIFTQGKQPMVRSTVGTAKLQDRRLSIDEL